MLFGVLVDNHNGKLLLIGNHNRKLKLIGNHNGTLWMVGNHNAGITLGRDMGIFSRLFARYIILLTKGRF